MKWVKHHGTEYRHDLIVCVEVAIEMPVFCKIKTIVVKDEQVILIGSDVETICFDEHYHAFKVVLKPGGALNMFDVKELFYFKPVDVLMTYGTTDCFIYIVPYCHLMQHSAVSLVWRNVFHCSVEKLLNKCLHILMK